MAKKKSPQSLNPQDKVAPWVPVEDQLSMVVSPRWTFDRIQVEAFRPSGYGTDIFVLVHGYTGVNKRIFRRFRLTKDLEYAEYIKAAYEAHSEEAAAHLLSVACVEFVENMKKQKRVTGLYRV